MVFTRAGLVEFTRPSFSLLQCFVNALMASNQQLQSTLFFKKVDKLTSVFLSLSGKISLCVNATFLGRHPNVLANRTTVNEVDRICTMSTDCWLIFIAHHDAAGKLC